MWFSCTSPIRWEGASKSIPCGSSRSRLRRSCQFGSAENLCSCRLFHRPGSRFDRLWLPRLLVFLLPDRLGSKNSFRLGEQVGLVLVRSADVVGKQGGTKIAGACSMMRSNAMRVLRCFSRFACSALYAFCCRSNLALRSSS